MYHTGRLCKRKATFRCRCKVTPISSSIDQVLVQMVSLLFPVCNVGDGFSENTKNRQQYAVDRWRRRKIPYASTVDLLLEPTCNFQTKTIPRKIPERFSKTYLIQHMKNGYVRYLWFSLGAEPKGDLLGLAFWQG